jgi:glycerol kinase
MSRYIGAIDQGTTSVRFIIFDRDGATIASAQMENRQIYPHPGWVEHDAAEGWRITQAVISQALASAGLGARDLAAVGITNQRCTTVLWDRNGYPLHHVLVWQDTRTDAQVAEMARDGGMERFRATTGLPLSTAFSAQLLRWLLNHTPNSRARIRSGELLAGTIDSWLVWNLTGQHITDVSNASLTQLMNLATLDWEPALLEVFDIPPAVLPRIVSSSAVYGTARGVLDGVPVAGILGDQQSALVGQACFQPGEIKSTYGTGGVLVMNTGEHPVLSATGLMTTVAYKLGEAPARYALEGPFAVAGSLVQWLRDNLKLIRSSAEIEALAASVPDNGGVYIVPAFSGLYAPHWRFDARGIIAGLTQFAHTGHIARAALEAVAYQTRDVVEAMERDSGIPIRALRVDGGMVVNELLMQFQSDILNVPVMRPHVLETTALGAAYAAGLAVGYWQGTEELVRNWRVARNWKPAMEEDRRMQLTASWKKALTRSFGWTSCSTQH